jgi:hypothetical protein
MKAKIILLALGTFTASVAIAQPSYQENPAPQDQPVQQAPMQEDMQGPSATMPGSQSSGSSQPSDISSQQQWQDQSSGSSASSSEMNIPPAAPLATRMEPQSENGFTYVCGGVGANEAQEMKQAARKYDMMLTFATKKGEFLANVNVNVQDAKGNHMLQTSCDSPMMLLNVPASGTYKIHAEAAGMSLNRTARVQAKQRNQAQLVMNWPQQVAEYSGEQSSMSSTGSSGSNAGSSGSSNHQGKYHGKHHDKNSQSGSSGDSSSSNGNASSGDESQR